MVHQYHFSKSQSQAKGCRADDVTFNTLIMAAKRAKNLDSALQLFHEMQTAGVQPNVKYAAMHEAMGCF